MCWGSVSRPSVKEKNPVNEETSNLLIRQWEPARWSEAKIKVWGSMDSKVMERANCKTGGEWRMGHCAGKHSKRWIATKNWMAMDQRESKRGVKVWCNAASLKAPLLKHTSNFFKCVFFSERAVDGNKNCNRLRTGLCTSVPNWWALSALPNLVTRGS